MSALQGHSVRFHVSPRNLGKDVKGQATAAPGAESLARLRPAFLAL
jgi:hypothetical protein